MRVPMDRSLSSHNWSLPVHDQRQTRWINADTRRITLLLTIAQDSKSAATWSLSGSRLATVSFALFSLFFFPSLYFVRERWRGRNRKGVTGWACRQKPIRMQSQFFQKYTPIQADISGRKQVEND